MYEQPFVRREPVMLNLAELGSGQNVKTGLLLMELIPHLSYNPLMGKC